ncbi:hypothetical protein Mapa_012245 [Marchantia paleacea]|nr:hypothetical protein Mapa_012245 [Marchantia paleacea]
MFCVPPPDFTASAYSSVTELNCTTVEEVVQQKCWETIIRIRQTRLGLVRTSRRRHACTVQHKVEDVGYKVTWLLLVAGLY